MSGRRAVDPPAPLIGEGYSPGLIGRIVTLHAETYSDLVGFGAAFEAKVAGELAEFVHRLNRPANGLWHVIDQNRIVGSIAIDGEDLSDGQNPVSRSAHLRWFIIAPSMRGAGIGRRLLARAIDFTDRHGFAETHLWTLKGLEAARTLYEDCGFVLTREYQGDQWGRRLTEQTFVRRSRSTT